MGPRANYVAAALAGAAAAVVGTLAISGSSRQPPAPAVPAPEVDVERRHAAEAAASPDVALLTRRLDTLQSSVDALARKVDAALEVRQVVAPTEGGAAVDGDVLLAALEQAQAKAERQKLDAMTTGEMLRSAEELCNSRKDLARARQLLEAALDRPLSVDERQKALLQLGIVHREGADFDGSKAVLQQAIDLAGGTDVQEGAWAAFQMAWTCNFAGDRAAARQWFERVGASTGSSEILVIEGRWNAAKLAAAAGDPRARAEFAAILQQCGDDPAFQGIADDCRNRLGR